MTFKIVVKRKKEFHQNNDEPNQRKHDCLITLKLKNENVRYDLKSVHLPIYINDELLKS